MIEKKTAPGPKPRFWGGNLIDFASGPLEFLHKSTREYGGIVRFKLGSTIMHVVTDPLLVEEVLTDKVAVYIKGEPYAVPRKIFGNGLVNLDGEEWRFHRRTIQPVFHHGFIESLGKIFVSKTLKAFQNLDRFGGSSNSVDVMPIWTSVTLDIVASSLFGEELEDRVAKLAGCFQEITFWFARHMVSPFEFMQKLPTPGNLRLKKSLNLIDQLIYGFIEKRRRSGEPGKDLLGLLLKARDPETGVAFTDKEIRDEAMIFLFAGHETTATALMWATHLLATHPQDQERLRKEIFALGDSILEPNFETLEKLAVQKRTFSEILRVLPPAWMLAREVAKDDVLGGYHIEKGSQVFLSPYITHRDPKHWDDPEKFDPDRFLPERAQGRHKFAYIPFLHGPRACVGQHFAHFEMMTVLSLFLNRYRFRADTEKPAIPLARGTLRPKDGVWIYLDKV